MKKVDKKVADAYFRERVGWIIFFFIIWFIASYGLVFFAVPLTNFTFLGFPFSYYMGAQGTIIVFIILLFANAFVSGKIDKKYGINEERNEKISSEKKIDL
ncbi:DUF4212 domain-containing protein [Virgibacillus sp. W0181]|uniref:DUF4212 domain-containing protein n=1 Tax=Virgibacillus sp. W0181 TaxID=3391581 RepID=UPI003F483D56